VLEDLAVEGKSPTRDGGPGYPVERA